MSPVQTGALMVPTGLHHKVVDSRPLLTIPGIPADAGGSLFSPGQLARRALHGPATAAR